MVALKRAVGVDGEDDGVTAPLRMSRLQMGEPLQAGLLAVAPARDRPPLGSVRWGIPLDLSGGREVVGIVVVGLLLDGGVAPAADLSHLCGGGRLWFFGPSAEVFDRDRGNLPLEGDRLFSSSPDVEVFLFYLHFGRRAGSRGRIHEGCLISSRAKEITIFCSSVLRES